jgi:hypothetical protein
VGICRAGIGLFLALVLALVHFSIAVRKLAGIYPLADRIFSGVGGAALCIVLTLAGAIFLVFALPDPASIYFSLRCTEITTHWQTDSKTGLAYFPIDYTSMDGGATTVPRNFFVLDKDGTFLIDRGTNNLRFPSCPEAKYSAKRLDSSVYIARIFIEDPDETSIPCLITPIAKARE